MQHSEQGVPTVCNVQKTELEARELEGIVHQLLAPTLSEAKQEEYEWYSTTTPFPSISHPRLIIRIAGTFTIKLMRRWLQNPLKRRMWIYTSPTYRPHVKDMMGNATT
jgi:hypothetical protein